MLKSILLAAMLALAPSYAFSGTVQHDMLDPVITIYNTEGKKCSAASIGDGFYLTASHCLSMSTTASGVTNIEEYEGFENPDNPPVKVVTFKWKMVTNHPGFDLAVIHFDAPELIKPAVEFTDKEPALGDVVFAVGYPTRYGKTITEGRAGTNYWYDAAMILEEDPAIRKAKGIPPNFVERSTAALPVYKGMSGGPRFVQEGDTYKLYSVNSVLDGEVAFMSMGPTVEQIKEFMSGTNGYIASVKLVQDIAKKQKQQSNQLLLKNKQTAN